MAKNARTAKVAKAAIQSSNEARAKGRCEICADRPIMSAAQKREHGDFPYCLPCLEESEWQNIHSDGDHENLPEGTAEDDMGYLLANCWICHPNLNQASADYVARAGTSRAGMKLHVSRAAAGAEKAEEVKAQFKELGLKSIVASENGTVTLTVSFGEARKKSTVTLAWDIRGRFLYAESKFIRYGSDRACKVRNVSEALRIVQA